ncbi:uncharacterized protein N7506_000230 [Penicillium brevicompactum]|uniref:uncharacterized protein n=1 Tax=Penicillium brevicompactum TaxID=5074 RepID=UPI00253FE87A|nr:uncharacterized protein N7506_000230 [Penicillium brevicompactum]KAJ5346977.1 hypothetical protein N7506_000230 [Penicillium brevicompactum]
MCLLFLPPELTLLVTSHLDSPKDFLGLLRASRKFYNLLINELYERNVRSDGGSALLWYVSRGDEVGVRNMLRAGANVNLRPPNRAQSTALLQAVTTKHTRVVQILLENGALPDAADAQSMRPLALATDGRSDTAITKLLLEYGAMANSVAFDKHTPLLRAVRSNQESKVSLLLNHGADAHILERRTGMNLLHIAASKNASLGIMKMLIDNGIPMDSQDRQGRTPLQVAVTYSSTRAVSLLLRLGANPNFKNEIQFWNGWTALFYAATKSSNSRSDNKTIIRTLVKHGAELDSKNYSEETPLLQAISRGAIKQAQVLLDCGASITPRDANGETVLHLAASSRSWCPNLMSRLVGNGADVNCAGGEDGETPIFCAIRNSHDRKGIECVQMLIFLGADIHFRNSYGLTPLSLAAQMGSVELTKLLLERGGSANSEDLYGKCPLHYAAEAYFGIIHKVVALLIQNGANVNSRDNSGHTPLHSVVAKEGAWEAVAELLTAGADRYAMSNDGKLPHDLVPDGPWAETKRLLMRFYLP